MKTAEEKYNVRKPLTVIIEPTYNCNLECKYCYVHQNAEKSIRMGEGTLENAITKFAFFNGKNEETRFLWHGGEPLFVGLGFYKEVVQIQGKLERKGYKFDNSMQTNGTLINEETAEFFKKYNFSIGLSIDGPKELNNKTRVYKKNKNADRGTFDDILNAIHLLREKGNDVGVIITLNKHNINELPLIYRFLKQEKLSAKFNSLLKSGSAIKNYEELAVSPNGHKKAKLEVLDMWINDEDPIHLTDFELMARNVLNKGKGCECYFSDSCQKSFISVGPDGDIYPCGEFNGNEKFRYGNINQDSIEKILLSPIRQQLLKRAKNIKQCTGCEYQELCNGGCMSNAHAFSGNVANKDPYCSVYKTLFGYFSDFIKKVKLEGGKENGST